VCVFIYHIINVPRYYAIAYLYSNINYKIVVNDIICSCVLNCILILILLLTAMEDKNWSTYYHTPARSSKSSHRKEHSLRQPQEQGCNILTKHIKVEKETVQDNGLFIMY
jgi:hypothetical protein